MYSLYFNGCNIIKLRLNCFNSNSRNRVIKKIKIFREACFLILVGDLEFMMALTELETRVAAQASNDFLKMSTELKKKYQKEGITRD